MQCSVCSFCTVIKSKLDCGAFKSGVLVSYSSDLSPIGFQTANGGYFPVSNPRPGVSNVWLEPLIPNGIF